MTRKQPRPSDGWLIFAAVNLALSLSLAVGGPEATVHGIVVAVLAVTTMFPIVAAVATVANHIARH